MSKTTQIEVGKVWISYDLSPDGTRMVLTTDEGTAVFDGIVALAISPVSCPMQTEEDKDIRDAWEYRLLDHRVETQRFYRTDARVIVVSIGPPALQVVYNADRQTLSRLRGFFLSGTYLDFTLICGDLSFSKGFPP